MKNLKFNLCEFLIPCINKFITPEVCDTLNLLQDNMDTLITRDKNEIYDFIGGEEKIPTHTRIILMNKTSNFLLGAENLYPGYVWFKIHSNEDNLIVVSIIKTLIIGGFQINQFNLIFKNKDFHSFDFKFFHDNEEHSIFMDRDSDDVFCRLQSNFLIHVIRSHRSILLSE